MGKVVWPSWTMVPDKYHHAKIHKQSFIAGRANY